MFVAREEELSVLQNMFSKNEFQMAVVYGRRRVGKTALLEKLSEGKQTLFFTAREQSSKANLKDFSHKIAETFELPPQVSSFNTWADALSFVATSAQNRNEQLLFVFDEFPYAAATDPALPSTLQVAIDHEFLKTNMLMVLCGSNEGFMESEVLGRKSPLYGRRNAQIRLMPFDCFDAAKMLSGVAPEDLVRYYATFGGTPYYLAQIDTSLPYEENAAHLLFSKFGLLYEEPLMLLRQELREPSLYNSILDAVAYGKTKPKQIAESAGMAITSVPKYLKTLETLGIIEKIAPFGEDAHKSRKCIYRMKDPFFAFWYRFVAPNIGAIESGAGAQVAHALLCEQNLTTYEDIQFERICEQWLTRLNKCGELGFLATNFGKWWGNNPAEHEEVDIDVIAANKQSSNIAFCECKWGNSFNETQALTTLQKRARMVKGYKNARYILFSKRPVSSATFEKYRNADDVCFYNLGDMLALQS